jgi:hypothetical protein
MKRHHLHRTLLVTAAVLVTLAAIRASPRSSAQAPEANAAAAETAGAAPQIDGCSVFPADNIWNTPVDTLPPDPNSSAYVSTIGAARTFHADFGSGLWDGGPIGIPYTTVPGNQPRVDISFDYAEDSDPADAKT